MKNGNFINLIFFSKMSNGFCYLIVFINIAIFYIVICDLIKDWFIFSEIPINAVFFEKKKYFFVIVMNSSFIFWGILRSVFLKKSIFLFWLLLPILNLLIFISPIVGVIKD